MSPTAALLTVGPYATRAYGAAIPRGQTHQVKNGLIGAGRESRAGQLAPRSLAEALTQRRLGRPLEIRIRLAPAADLAAVVLNPPNEDCRRVSYWRPSVGSQNNHIVSHFRNSISQSVARNSDSGRGAPDVWTVKTRISQP